MSLMAPIPRRRPAARPRGATWRTAAAAGLLALASVLVFLPALRNGFVFDDREYVLENDLVRGGLGLTGLAAALTAVRAANWHPLTWVSHQADVTLFGVDARGHHLTSVLLHALAAALCFLALRRLTGAAPASLLAAALFALHPLRVESVAWIAERKDVLSGALFMALLLSWCRFLAAPRLSRYALTLVFFALGLAAKPILVTVPLLLLLLDWWPLGRMRGGLRLRVLGALALEKLPLLLLALGAAVLTFRAQLQGGTVSTLAELPLAPRLANAIVGAAGYLGLWLWPSGLLHFYEYPAGGWEGWQAARAGAILAGVTLVALWQARRRPYFAAGWAWYLLLLLPVAGLVQVGAQSMADRYTYLALVGPALSLALWLAQLAPRRGAGRALTAAAAAAAAALCVALTRGQIAVWASEERLWGRALEVTGGSAVAHHEFGLVLEKSGRRAEAETQYRLALRRDPDHAQVLGRLGVLLARGGRGPEALVLLERAASLPSRSAAILSDLGLVLHGLGRGAEARARLEESLRLDPALPEAYNNLGLVLAQAGALAEAAVAFRRALALRPGYDEARANLERASRLLARPPPAPGP